ncbi:MAG: hypothetical protein WEC80_00360 [Patescibacteria group bacterium]
MEGVKITSKKAEEAKISIFLSGEPRRGRAPLRIKNSVSSFFQKHRLFNFLVIAITFYFLLFTYKFVFAQAVVPLTVSPARHEILINPGEQQTVNVKFLNQGDSPIAGNIQIADFIVDNTDGIPRILDDPSQSSPKYSAASWITSLVDRIAIASNDQVQLQFTLNAPESAPAGGRYVAIYFEPGGVVPSETGADQEAGSGISTRLVSLLYIRVSGEISEQALASRFFANPFIEFGPINIETDILNRGDYHIRPKGIIALVNPFGSVIAQEKLKEENIFPDTVRTFENELGSKYMFGRYKVSLTAAYGDQGQSLSRSIFVWVIPWRLILITILSLIIIAFIIKSMKKRSGKTEESLKRELELEKQEIDKLKKQINKRAD